MPQNCPFYQDNAHTKHARVVVYLRASLISQLIQVSLLIVLYSADSEVCMLGQCDKCAQWLESLPEEDLSLMVTWYQWERVVQKTGLKKAGWQWPKCRPNSGLAGENKFELSKRK